MPILSTIFVIGALVVFSWSVRIMRNRKAGESRSKENILFGVFIVLWLAAMIVVASGIKYWVW